MKDIQTTEDIGLLIDRFYKKVVIDPIIGDFFTKVVTLSWEEHIPVMISFWETTLLGKISYRGNPMVKHIGLNKLAPQGKIHFDRWLELWTETVHENFAGPIANDAIIRATSIAQVMQWKIAQSSQ